MRYGLEACWRQTLCGGVLMACMGAAMAQTLYRCGNSYQDKPCANGQQGKVITVLKGADASPVSLNDAKCSQRGQEAQKLMWARESGVLEADMLAKAKSASERDLVGTVYRQRGSSAQVRQAVEAACVAEKDRAASGGMGLSSGATAVRQDSAPAGAGAGAAASTGKIGKANCEQLRSEMGKMLGKDAGKEQQEALNGALRNAGC